MHDRTGYGYYCSHSVVTGTSVGGSCKVRKRRAVYEHLWRWKLQTFDRTLGCPHSPQMYVHTGLLALREQLATGPVITQQSRAGSVDERGIGFVNSMSEGRS